MDMSIFKASFLVGLSRIYFVYLCRNEMNRSRNDDQLSQGSCCGVGISCLWTRIGQHPSLGFLYQTHHFCDVKRNTRNIMTRIVQNKNESRETRSCQKKTFLNLGDTPKEHFRNACLVDSNEYSHDSARSSMTGWLQDQDWFITHARDFSLENLFLPCCARRIVTKIGCQILSIIFTL